MSNKLILDVKDLSINYGRISAVKKISFQVFEGEIISLVGSNGAGKTSTLKACSGLLDGVKGQILFQNQDISHLSPEHRVKLGMAHVPEGRGIFLNMSVKENLELGAYTRKSKSEINKNIELNLLRFPRLKERWLQQAGTLSGGEQQMLSISRALMSEPKLLLLDEPSMGLAPIIVKDIFNMLVQLNQQGMTILLVEQNAKAAMKMSHRVYVLETGSIVLTGLGSELLNNPEVQKSYLGL